MGPVWWSHARCYNAGCKKTYYRNDRNFKDFIDNSLMTNTLHELIDKIVDDSFNFGIRRGLISKNNLSHCLEKGEFLFKILLNDHFSNECNKIFICIRSHGFKNIKR